LAQPAGAKAEFKIPSMHFAVAPIIVGHPLRRPEALARDAPQIIWVEG